MRILPHRFWWLALLAFVTSTLISLFILANSVLVKAQSTSLTPAIKGIEWAVYTILPETQYFPDSQSACEAEKEDILRTTIFDDVTLLSITSLYDDNHNFLGGVSCNFNAGFKNGEHVESSGAAFIVCRDEPDGSTYSISNNNEFCVLNPSEKSPITYSDVPDLTPCTYYDDIANKYQCNYHRAAADICKAKDDEVNLLNAICTLTESDKNCLRNCLVNADNLVQSGAVPSCLTKSTPIQHCTKKSCIDAYHNVCFPRCGLPTRCYGGNYDSLPFIDYPNDGDE